MLTECPCCKKQRNVPDFVQTHRRLTQYHSDAENWITCCKDCKAEDDEHWKEMWKDYYNSQGFGESYY